MENKEVPQVSIPEESDSLAKEEADAFDKGADLQKEAKKKDHHRKQDVLDCIHKAAKNLFWLVVWIIAITVLVLAWHYLAPESYGWLSKNQIEKLQTILFSGSAAALLQIISRRYL